MLTTKAQGRGIVAAKPSILEEADVCFGSILLQKSVAADGWSAISLRAAGFDRRP